MEADLEFHWGEAYEIWRDPDGDWLARFRSERWNPVLFGTMDRELREAIRADYYRRTMKAARPGSRGARAGGLRLVTSDD